MTATIARPRIDWLARLRSVMVLRPGQRVAHVPGIGVRASRRAVSSGAVDWWLAGGAPTPVAVYQPKGAASLAASYVNLANPGTYDAAPGVAPTWDTTNGWIGNGSSVYLTTGIVVSGAYTAIVRFAGSSAASKVLLGAYSGATSKQYQINVRQAGASDVILYTNGSQVTYKAASAIVSGVVGIAGTQGYWNGTAAGGTLAGASGITHGLFLFATNVTGSPSGCFDGSIHAVAIWDTSTNHATWMPAVSAAMAAL